MPMRHYYSTNGITAPLELAAMDRPNNTQYALLPPDPMEEIIVKDRKIPN